ncbi:MAG: trypsin-like peptidase domain-containing protein [Candidatus Pacebacteria bacterium]|nr:trypsin-like peptidase domain-containing protein [Candidatus Paceibacterota bacterium]
MNENIKSIIKKNRTVIITSVLTSIVTLIIIIALLGVFVVVNKDSLQENLFSFLSSGGAIEGEQYGIISRNAVAEESRIIDIVEKSNPAVISIVITKDVPIIEQYYENFNPFGDDFFNDFFGGDGFGFRIPQYREKGTEKKEIGGGSGFFVSSEGFVVTNRHVVDDDKAEYTVLTNDGEKYEAKVLAKDSALDIAILKVKGNDFSYLEFGDSDLLKPGQTVIAIGNALAEFRNSVSVGVISGLSRSIVAGDFSGRSELLEGVIQTDAAINPGNSGGPLLDIAGKVVGVNVAVQRGAENIGFALPSNTVKSIVDSVKEHGEIVRPYLGVRYIQVTESLKKKNNLSVDYGALIVRGETAEDLAIIPGSPADKAGLVENDIILEVDGVKLDNKKSLALLIRQKKVGDTITLKVLSKGNEKEVKVTLEKAPEGM